MLSHRIPVSPMQKHQQPLHVGRLPTCGSSSLPRPSISCISASFLPDKRSRHIEGLKQVYIPKLPTVLPVKKIPLVIHLSYPEGVESRLLWLTKLVTWFVVFDSDMDNMEHFGTDVESTVKCIQDYIGLLEGGKVSNVNNDLLGIFATIWEEAVETMQTHHYCRFHADTVKMFQSEIKQNKLRGEGQIPGSIEELLAARRETGYFTALTHLVEYIIGMDADDEVKQAVDTTIADDYITLSNDVVSMRQEYLNNDYHNVPCTIAILNSISLDEAMQQTADLAQVMVDRYNQVRDSVLQAQPNSPEAKSYIDGLGHIMAGNLEWSWHTGRYHGQDWVAPQEREGLMYLKAGKTATFVPASKLVYGVFKCAL